MMQRSMQTGRKADRKEDRPGPPRTPILSRRELLQMAGMATLAAALPSCGGGSSGATGGNGATVAPRTVPTGSLTNQINQYSRLVDDLSLSFGGHSPLLDEMAD